MGRCGKMWEREVESVFGVSMSEMIDLDIMRIESSKY